METKHLDGKSGTIGSIDKYDRALSDRIDTILKGKYDKTVKIDLLVDLIITSWINGMDMDIFRFKIEDFKKHGVFEKDFVSRLTQKISISENRFNRLQTLMENISADTIDRDELKKKFKNILLFLYSDDKPNFKNTRSYLVQKAKEGVPDMRPLIDILNQYSPNKNYEFSDIQVEKLFDFGSEYLEILLEESRKSLENYYKVLDCITYIYS